MKLTKKSIKKITLRLTATLTLCLLILAIGVLYPSFSYAKSTTANDKVTIYHSQELDADLIPVINQSYEMIKHAEIFNPDFTISVCLNDGSYYPGLIRKIRGEAFAYGFFHNTVVAVDIFPKENYTIWQGRKRILTEMFAHEFIHNLQYDAFGFKTLNLPFWKLEGYPEYVMTRQNPDVDLKKDIAILLDSEKEGMQDWDWIESADGFGTTPIYLRSRMYVQFLMEIEGESYEKIVNDDKITEESTRQSMLKWYRNQ